MAFSIAFLLIRTFFGSLSMYPCLRSSCLSGSSIFTGSEGSGANLSIKMCLLKCGFNVYWNANRKTPNPTMADTPTSTPYMIPSGVGISPSIDRNNAVGIITAPATSVDTSALNRPAPNSIIIMRPEYSGVPAIAGPISPILELVS